MSATAVHAPRKVAIAGFGTIGRSVAERLSRRAVEDAVLAAISARDILRAEQASAHLCPVPAVVPVARLPDLADIVVEAASKDAFGEIATLVLEAGRILVPVSVSAFPRHSHLIALARRTGGRIVIPSGGVIGLDAVKAAAEDGIARVLLRMRLHPDSLAKERFVHASGIDLAAAADAPLQVFRGSARESAEALPNHCNNPVALSLAGVGVDRTLVEIVADASLPGARVEVEVDAEAVSLRLCSQNLPSPASPRVSRIIAPSVIAAIRGLVAPITVGS